MSNIQTQYVVLYLIGVFVSSISQVLLKKATFRQYKNCVAEYLNVRVIGAYVLFFLCTMMTVFSYKGLPLNMGPVLETTGYIYVTFFGVVIFKEKLTAKKVIALAMIVIGILIYSTGGMLQ